MTIASDDSLLNSTDTAHLTFTTSEATSDLSGKTVAPTSSKTTTFFLPITPSCLRFRS